MPDQAQQQALSHLNQTSLNQAALKLLPPGWRGTSTLHVLSLALYGTVELGIGVEQPGAPLTDDALEQALIALHDKPTVAMDLLEPGDEALLLAEDLGDTVEEGARSVLEAIRDALVAHE